MLDDLFLDFFLCVDHDWVVVSFYLRLCDVDLVVFMLNLLSVLHSIRIEELLIEVVQT